MAPIAWQKGNVLQYHLSKNATHGILQSVMLLPVLLTFMLCNFFLADSSTALSLSSLSSPWSSLSSDSAVRQPNRGCSDLLVCMHRNLVDHASTSRRLQHDAIRSRNLHMSYQVICRHIGGYWSRELQDHWSSHTRHNTHLKKGTISVVTRNNLWVFWKLSKMLQSLV